MQPVAYVFGDYRIDLARRELRRAGELLAPSAKVFDCIAYLIEHRERAVGRDELIAAVWGRTDVTYATLGQFVIKARRALGGDGNDQHAIRTLPRFGYRWVADAIPEAGADADRNDVAPSGIRVHRTRPMSRVWFVVLAATAVLGIAAGFEYIRSRAVVVAAGAPPRAIDAIAVLPIELRAGEPWSWVRLGVMDLVAERLRDAGLPVVPSENVVALARDPVHAADIVRGATGVQRVIAARAWMAETEWSVRLVLTSSRGVEKTVEAHGDEVTTAAQRAADLMLAALGKPLPQAEAASRQPLVMLLARAKSKMLDNELNAARRILESAPPELQESLELRRWLAKADERSGLVDVAQRRLDALLGEITVESNPGLRAAVLNDLGVAALHSNQPDAAERRFDESLSLLAHQGDPAELGRAHLGRGIADAQRGRYDRAALEFGRARVAYGASGHAIALATLDVNEAALEIRFGRPAAAKPMLERAADRFEQLGARFELFSVLATRMKVELALLEPEQAYAIHARWRPQVDELQSPRIRQRFLLESAEVLIATGRLHEAREALDLLAHESDSAGDPFKFSAEIQSGRARLDFTEGRLGEALAESARAVEGLVLPDDAQMRARVWLTAVRTLTALGRDAEATAELQRFSAWAGHGDVAFASWHATLAEAERAAREGRDETARDAWETALRAAARSGVPSHLAEVAESYGTRLLVRHDFDRAATVIGSIARYAPVDYRCAVLVARLHHASGRDDDWRAAMQWVHALAGERPVPADIETPPSGGTSKSLILQRTAKR